MRQFIGGIMFTASIALFGKGMYGLGRLDERRRIHKEIRKEFERLCEEIKEMEEEA